MSQVSAQEALAEGEEGQLLPGTIICVQDSGGDFGTTFYFTVVAVVLDEKLWRAEALRERYALCAKVESDESRRDKWEQFEQWVDKFPNEPFHQPVYILGLMNKNAVYPFSFDCIDTNKDNVSIILDKEELTPLRSQLLASASVLCGAKYVYQKRIQENVKRAEHELAILHKYFVGELPRNYMDHKLYRLFMQGA